MRMRIELKKKIRFTLRSGQTVVEYGLVAVSMLIIFVLMYNTLHPALSKYFKQGGMVIVTPYR